jgi:hypothetical protein
VILLFSVDFAMRREPLAVSNSRGAHFQHIESVVAAISMARRLAGLLDA